MPEQLSEYDAWRLLANKWRQAGKWTLRNWLKSQINTPSIYVEGSYQIALCSCIRLMEGVGRITAATADSMLAKIRAYKDSNKITCMFLWPRTLAGAAGRAAFCKKSATTCQEKRRLDA